MKCKNCSQDVKKGNKFCSQSCAASYNNKRRKHTLETKRKISKSLGGKGIAKEEKVCILCGKKNIDGDKYCDSCYKPMPPSEETIKASMLSFHFYEEELSLELEKIYGKLKKEIIKGIAFDFCNENYIIEFTYDYGRGTSQAIDRFVNLGDCDKRTKILYIPSKYVGEKRKNRLSGLNITIKPSDQFKKEPGILKF